METENVLIKAVTVNRPETVHGTLRFLYLSHLLYGICVKIFLIQRATQRARMLLTDILYALAFYGVYKCKAIASFLASGANVHNFA